MSFDTTTIKQIGPLVAGTFGGGVSTILLYPLDLVKVRLQVNENRSGTRISIWSIMRGVMRHEGFFGLYQGIVPAILGNAISWGGYFFFYERIKTLLVERQRKLHNPQIIDGSSLSHYENFGAACVSGSLMVLITNPLWLIKTRMQLQLKRTQQTMMEQMPSVDKMNAPYKNMFDAARIIVKEEGPMALYKGTIPALLLTSHGGVQFVVYEFLKKTTQQSLKERPKSNQDGDLSITERFKNSMKYLMMGGCSKVVASTVTFPLQTIKARIQQRNQKAVEIMDGGEIVLMKRTKYNGVIDCVQGIWRNEGISGFFKGSIPNALRVAPSSAVTFVIYEGIMDVFRSLER